MHSTTVVTLKVWTDTVENGKWKKNNCKTLALCRMVDFESP